MQKPLCRSVAVGGRFRGRKVESVNGERSRLGLARRSLSSAGRGLAPRCRRVIVRGRRRYSERGRESISMRLKMRGEYEVEC
jgi:hypothetical protein